MNSSRLLFFLSKIHKELIDQLFECCALVLVAQDMLDGSWKEKCEVACNTDGRCDDMPHAHSWARGHVATRVQ